MVRKKREGETNITPALLKLREKKKWQIALRRYVLEKQPSIQYAPYFGLDINFMRNWFEIQFKEGVDWEDFGQKWQFDHVLPVTCFDFSNEGDLKQCWNFTNLRVDLLHHPGKGYGLNLSATKSYFQHLYNHTHYKPCRELLEKVNQLEQSETINAEKQLGFIKANMNYLEMIENYSSFEFELLNSGRSIEDVNKEVSFLKKF